MGMSDRIKERRLFLGFTQEELGQKLGLQKSAIAKYENGRVENIKRSTIQKMAEILQCSPAYLMGWDETDNKESSVFKGITSIDDGSFVKIPVFASVSAGPGCFADSNIEGYVSIPEHLARKGEFYGLRVRGSSMDPEIKDQDVVVVQKTPVVEDGDTVVAVVNGDLGYVKRFVKYAEGISLVSINASEYPPMIFSAKQIETLPVTIKGVVVQLIRNIKE